ncbi:MAG: hypothetical protein EBE86_014485 [Hormoscilla sp. GUM202]|nr:hypothetical protein [Hormoscilla sp. GUM202]
MTKPYQVLTHSSRISRFRNNCQPTWGLDASAGHLPIFPWGLAIEKLRKDQEEKGIVGWVMDGVGEIWGGVVGGVVGVGVQVGVEKVGEAIIAAVMESL